MTLDNIIKLAELFDRDPDWIHDCIRGGKRTDTAERRQYSCRAARRPKIKGLLCNRSDVASAAFNATA